MKIGIYACGLGHATSGGVEVYFRNLIKGLYDYDTEHRYLVFLDDRQIKKMVEPYHCSRIRIVYLPELSFKFRIRSLLPFPLLVLMFRPGIFFKLLANRMARIISSSPIFDVDIGQVYGRIYDPQIQNFGIDMVHFPVTMIHLPFSGLSMRVILTVHDIQQEYYPEFFSPSELKMRKEAYKPSAERADVVIAISEQTKRSLIDKYGIDPGKIVVAYLGCSDDFRKMKEGSLLNSVRIKYNLPASFMLYPASTWPHKNHLKLIEALSILKTEYAFEGSLVLTGIPMNNHREILDAIEKRHLSESVKFLNFISFGDLPVLYHLAKLMVFPSLFEGFGMPLVEAMNTGLPIVCSNRTALPEIVGHAGVYFDPDSAEDMAKKIYKVWTDGSLREELIQKGSEQAKKFDWRKGIEATLAAYKKCETLMVSGMRRASEGGVH